jgi:hypothetical protein
VVDRFADLPVIAKPFRREARENTLLAALT